MTRPTVFHATVLYLLDNVRVNGACIEWTGRYWQGNSKYGLLYGTFQDPGGSDFAETRRRRHSTAHRIVFEMIHGPIPTGLCVCHRCDNTKCVNPKHLFLATAKENTHDSMAKGRRPAKAVA